MKYKGFPLEKVLMALCFRKRDDWHNLFEVEIFANELANEETSILLIYAIPHVYNLQLFSSLPNVYLIASVYVF